MNKSMIVIKQIDKNLLPATPLADIRMPPEGWIRTIRKALGMTLKQLAKRMGTGASRVVKIEMTEREDGITLRTLRAAAEALDCNLVYAFVPNSGLEQTVRAKARTLALKQLQKSSHTMDLEAQSVSSKWLDDQLDDLTTELLQKSWKHLWEDQ